MTVSLRNYQEAAVNAVYEAFREFHSALVVMPTGCGKTITLAEAIRRCKGRALVIAHREELIFQNAKKIEQVTGEEPAIEMAEYSATSSTLYSKNRVVVASIQTLNAGAGGAGRMTKFDPMEFDLVIIDEAHHATARTYRKVIAYFRQNPNLKILGVTATPDRADEEALGQVFESVAFNYEIVDAIHDGWLVPIETQSVMVEGLDLSSVRTTAGDLNGADLARVMEYEGVLHEVAHPAFEIAAGRKMLVFAASVAQAERLAEIFNRHEAGCANWVCGETPKEDRRRMFADYAVKKFQILVNVGVATEGFDDPGIEVVAIARPTKSRSLYAQMIGRGTRPLPGVVDLSGPVDLFMPELTPAERTQRILSSGKAKVLILDFVGNSGKHKLVTAADILGGNHTDEVVEKAKEKVEAAGKAMNMLDALDEAEEEAKAEREAERVREESRRNSLRLKAKYATAPVDAFDIFGITAPREHGWDKGRQLSAKQLDILERQGIATAGISYAQGKALLDEIFRRWNENKQRKAAGLHPIRMPDLKVQKAMQTVKVY